MLTYIFMALTVCLHLNVLYETFSVSFFKKNNKFDHLLVYMFHFGQLVLFFIQNANVLIKISFIIDNLIDGIDRMIQTLSVSL